MAIIDIKYANGSAPDNVGNPFYKPDDYSGIINFADNQLEKYKAELDHKEKLRKAVVDATYNANTTVSINDKIEKAKKDNQQLLYTDPEAYKKAVTEAISPEFDSALSNAPSDHAKVAMASQIAQMKVQTNFALSNDVKQAQVSNSLSSTKDSLDTLAAQVRRDPNKYEEVEMQREKLLAGVKPIFDPEKYNKLNTFSSDQIDMNYLQGVADNNPEAALKITASGKFDHLGGDQIAKIEYQASQNIVTRNAEQQKAQEDARQEVVLGYKTALAETRDLGTANRLVHDILAHEDVLGKSLPPILEEAYAKYDHWKAKQEEVVRLATFTDSGNKLDPSDHKDLKRSDIAFDEMRDKYNKADVQTKINMASNFLDQYGVIPPSVRDGMLSGLRNGGVEQKVQAAAALTGLVNQDKRFAREFSGDRKELALAQTIHYNVSMGMPPADAVKAAETKLEAYGVSDPRQKARAVAFKDEKKPIIYSDFTQLFRLDPSKAPDEMIKEANDLYYTYSVDIGMDPKKARELSIITTNSKWGITTINGKKEFTRNPVGEVRGSGIGDEKWMRSQLESEVKMGAVSTTGEPIDVTKIKILPVPDYLSTTGKPEYAVVEQHDDGTQSPLLTKKTATTKGGMPFVWYPKLSNTAQYQKVETISNTNLEKLNNSANSQTAYRYRHTLMTNALKRNDLNHNLRTRIRREMIHPARMKPIQDPVSNDDLIDIQPVEINK